MRQSLGKEKDKEKKETRKKVGASPRSWSWHGLVNVAMGVLAKISSPENHRKT